MNVNDPDVRNWLNTFYEIFTDMGKRLDEVAAQTGSSREQVRATTDGYQKIATALERGLERGFREIASAIRDSNHR